MKPFIIHLSLIFLLPAACMAQNPVFQGLEAAAKVFAPVPSETADPVRATAAEVLARHLKQRGDSWLAQISSGMWTEMKNLGLTRVTANAVSQADMANGMAESYLVSVDCGMYRTYDAKTAAWSKWYDGGNPFLPSVVTVTRAAGGRWVATIPQSTRLVMFSAHGDPDTIPHGSPSAPTSRPPVFSTAAPRILPPAPTSKTITPSVQQASSSASKDLLNRGVFWIVIISLFSGLVSLIKTKRPRRNGKSVHRGRSQPPALPPAGKSSTPPALPASASPQARNPIDLIQRKENLMTPAEQSFYSVLEPIVRASCMVSSKVRLADLFEVRQEAGQQAAFNKIRSKHIDFVLTDPSTSRILCAIELDDSSHNRPDRMERDHFLNELCATHRLPLMRVPVAWTYYPQALRTELLKAGVPLPSAT